MSIGFLKGQRKFDTLSYANPADPLWRQKLIQTIETLSGRDYFVDIYEQWRTYFYRQSATPMQDMLRLSNIGLKINGEIPKQKKDHPFVIVANHPYGIGDGIALLSIAEQMDRPYRVLINNELLKVPEIQDVSLPINFEETKEALAQNLQTRKEALRLLNEGTNIVVFPAGGVATAPKGFGKAEDLPWKLFTAKLILSAKADVLPVFFEGQNSWSFHFASRFSMMLRTSLFIREFRNLVGEEITAHIGKPIDFKEIQSLSSRQEITDFLYNTVFRLNQKK
jgi:putative hemolysin